MSNILLLKDKRLNNCRRFLSSLVPSLRFDLVVQYMTSYDLECTERPCSFVALRTTSANDNESSTRPESNSFILAMLASRASWARHDLLHQTTRSDSWPFDQLTHTTRDPVYCKFSRATFEYFSSMGVTLSEKGGTFSVSRAIFSVFHWVS